MRLWVAEGFVEKKGDSTPEEVAEGYLTELIHRNMLQLVENDELGRVSTCKMHDILRELALCISKAEMRYSKRFWCNGADGHRCSSHIFLWMEEDEKE